MILVAIAVAGMSHTIYLYIHDLLLLEGIRNARGRDAKNGKSASGSQSKIGRFRAIEETAIGNCVN
jgi:hypothetical protein